MAKILQPNSERLHGLTPVSAKSTFLSVHKGFPLEQSSSLSCCPAQALLIHVLHLYFPSLSQVPLLGPSSLAAVVPRAMMILGAGLGSGAFLQLRQQPGALLQLSRAVPSSQIPFLPPVCVATV